MNTAFIINKMKYSIFTIALLEDSGWYEVDYSLADTYDFGFSNGCNFFVE